MSDRKTVKILKALGNERRFSIIKYLFVKKELTVGQISELIKLSFKSTSRHLAVLSNADLVQVKQSNLNRFYSISSTFPKEFAEIIKNNK